jgi:hypothetical protein
MLSPPEWIKKKHETRLEIRLINGTVIQLKGADRPDTLRGRGVHFIILDEFQDFRPEVWDKVLYPTLTTTRGQMLCIGTPKSYNHFYELYRMGQIVKNRRSGQWWSWQFPTIMSPFFPPSEIAHARANLDPKTFRQEFEASFESMAGRVYYAFDRKQHVGLYPFNPRLPIIVGQDFNVDPMSRSSCRCSRTATSGSSTRSTCRARTPSRRVRSSIAATSGRRARSRSTPTLPARTGAQAAARAISMCSASGATRRSSTRRSTRWSATVSRS